MLQDDPPQALTSCLPQDTAHRRETQSTTPPASPVRALLQPCSGAPHQRSSFFCCHLKQARPCSALVRCPFLSRVQGFTFPVQELFLEDIVQRPAVRERHRGLAGRNPGWRREPSGLAEGRGGKGGRGGRGSRGGRGGQGRGRGAPASLPPSAPPVMEDVVTDADINAAWAVRHSPRRQ